MAAKPKRKGTKRPYYFDQEKADAAVAFIETFLRFVDGEWAGRPFILEPWQAYHVRQIFGWRRRKNGLRRYRFVRIWVPRKNGKTELAAAFAHLLTIGDGEPGAQVYSHALDAKQAGLTYDKAARMVALSGPLSKIYTVTKTGMMDEGTMASFRPLSGEAYGKHGLSPHANIGDEAHAWKNGRLHTFLIQGMGARRQPLDITISTAGEIKTYGHELYEASKAILADPSLDPETYVAIYEADKDDDWTDPKVWAKANPNLGVSLKLEFLEAECKRALQTPRLENDFKRYHLNIWVEQKARWLPMRRWPQNTAHPNDPMLWKKLPQQFVNWSIPPLGGLDLASTSDICALVWVFPPKEPGGRVTLIPRFWVPEDTVAERDSVRTPYRRWVDQHAMLTTPGNVTDYNFIEEQVKQDAASFGCGGLGYDPWRATQTVTNLQNEGLPLVEFRQGARSMGAGTSELERLFISGQLEHGNHPVLQWMFGNATVRADANNNIIPDKKSAAEKIDGVIGAVLGISLMGVKPETVETNAFELLARQMQAGALPLQADAKATQGDDGSSQLSDSEILKDPSHPKFNEARERLERALADADEDDY